MKLYKSCDKRSDEEAGAKTLLLSAMSDSESDEGLPPSDSEELSHWTVMLGLLLAALWGASMAVVGLLVKLADDMSPTLLAAYRFWCLLAVSVVGFCRAPDRWRVLTGRQWALVWLRAVIGTVGQFCQLYAIRFMPLADASAILFTDPAIVTALEILFFQLQCRLHHGLAIAATLCGAVLAANPTALFGQTFMEVPDSGLQLLGALLAVAGALCLSVVALLLRSLADVPASAIYFSYALLSTLSAMLVSAGAGELRLPTGPVEIGVVAALMVTSWSVQATVTNACRRAPVPLVVTLKTVALHSLSLLLQDLVLAETPSLTSTAGTLMIASAAIILGLAKWSPSGWTTSPESGAEEKQHDDGEQTTSVVLQYTLQKTD